MRRTAAVLVVASVALVGCGSSKKSTTTTKTTLNSKTTTTIKGATSATTLAPVTIASTTVPPTVATTPAPVATPTTVAFKAESTTGALSKGVKGPRTTALQSKLKALGYDPGPADGLFGEKTEAAVKKFQSDKKLQIDGVAGPQTLSAVDSACKTKSAC